MSPSSPNTDLALETSSSIRQISILLKSHQPAKELKNFYSHLRAHCLLISDHVTRIKPAVAPSNELIIRVLHLFESLIIDSETRDEESRRMFPRQRALNKRWHNLQSRSQAIKVEFARACLNVERFAELPFRQKFDEDFYLWEEEVVAKYPEDGSQWTTDDRPPPKKTRPEPPYAVWVAAQSVFKALTRCIKCECHQTHELHARLSLGTYRKPDPDNITDFNMFLSLPQALQEVHVHTVRESVVRIIIDDDKQVPPKKLNYKPMVVKELCEQIQKMQKKTSQRLEFKVERGRLLKLRSEKSCFQVDRAKPTISLQQLINQSSRPLTEKTKRILAVLLSYAVLHLHGTPWLPPSWDSSKILFFQTLSSTVPLRPFIRTDLSSQDTLLGQSPIEESVGHCGLDMTDVDEIDPDDLDPDDFGQDGLDPDDFEHPFPTLVTLAVVLMELYFATPFEELARNRGFDLPEGTESRKRSLDVSSIFNEYRREMPQNSPFYYAIEKCLDPRTWENDDGEKLDDDMLRVMVYEEVVRPLEDDLCDAFTFITIEKLDEIAENVDVGAWGRTIQNMQFDGQQRVSSPPVEQAMLPHSHQFPGLQAHIQQPLFVALNWSPANFPGLVSNISRPWTPSFDYEAAKFYDDEMPSGCHSNTEVQKYLNWKAKYQAVYESFIDPYLQGPPKFPVRIATSKSKKDTEDHDGHGTFTASLIIEYAPHAKVYVAKVANKELSPPAVIAEAIKFAVDDWGVDIISMSFGYPTNQIDGYSDLEQAILYAHSKNVLLFAAASNSGANLDRAYPARDPHVICVHSTDSNGNRSNFSPTAIAHDLNIATVGEAVQSAWPVDLCDTRVNPDCVQLKSGTSYATPIAVGIAGFLLQYARLHLEDQADMLKRQSRMEQMLQKIAQKTQQSISRDDYDYIAISKFSDNLFGKDKSFIDATMSELLKR